MTALTTNMAVDVAALPQHARTDAGAPLRVGVVGAGYWGPKLIRNFALTPQADLRVVCDLAEERLQALREQHPDVALTTSFDALLAQVDAVAIATPVATHYRLVKQALTAGKHVLVEKPLTTSVREASEVVALAAQQGLMLMVGHTFLFEPAVEQLRALIQSGELGEIWHVSAQRLNLGLFRHDVNVLWDLAPHDISILLEILGTEPVAVSARGACHVQPGIQDVAYVELRFPGGTMAHVHVSWLDPGKVRSMTIIGSRKMAVFDDTAADKLRVFDRGVVSGNPHDPQRELMYRFGETTSVPIEGSEEPLRRQCAYFVDCARSGARPRPDGQQGLKVVRILEQADRSLQNSGHREEMGWDLAGWADMPSHPAWLQHLDGTCSVPRGEPRQTGRAARRERALVPALAS
jgi:predicted dehydrogenase